MSWGGWSDFWAMGGYGLYVWGSYAVTALFILTEVALLVLRRKAVRQTLNRLARVDTQLNPGKVDGKAFNEAET